MCEYMCICVCVNVSLFSLSPVMNAYMHEHCVTLAWVREPELFYGRVLASAFEQKKTQSNQIKSHGIAPITSDRTRSHCPIPSDRVQSHSIKLHHGSSHHTPSHPLPCPIPSLPSHHILSKLSLSRPIQSHPSQLIPSHSYILFSAIFPPLFPARNSKSGFRIPGGDR